MADPEISIREMKDEDGKITDIVIKNGVGGTMVLTIAQAKTLAKKIVAMWENWQ